MNRKSVIKHIIAEAKGNPILAEQYALQDTLSPIIKEMRALIETAKGRLKTIKSLAMKIESGKLGRDSLEDVKKFGWGVITSLLNYLNIEIQLLNIFKMLTKMKQHLWNWQKKSLVFLIVMCLMLRLFLVELSSVVALKVLTVQLKTLNCVKWI